jgi:hypothetical protein
VCDGVLCMDAGPMRSRSPLMCGASIHLLNVRVLMFEEVATC